MPHVEGALMRRVKPGRIVPVNGVYDGERRESEQSRRERESSEDGVLQRQFDVYELRCTGATLREISQALGISYQTVVDDIAVEGARRSLATIAGSQDIKAALSVARYERVINRAITRMAEQAEQAKNGVRGAGRMAFMDEKIVLEAQERIDRVLGLLRTVPNETPAPAPDTTVNVVLQQFTTLPPDMRLEILRAVRERKAKVPD